MSELTDLYLVKKLAEIERLPERGFELTPYRVGKLVSRGKFVEWNPLTDKALCFDLMVRHSLNLHREWSGLWSACNVCSYDHSENPIDFDVYESDENPQKAICLAIIAKHNKE